MGYSAVMGENWIEKKALLGKGINNLLGQKTLWDSVGK